MYASDQQSKTKVTRSVCACVSVQQLADSDLYISLPLWIAKKCVYGSEFCIQWNANMLTIKKTFAFAYCTVVQCTHWHLVFYNHHFSFIHFVYITLRCKSFANRQNHVVHLLQNDKASKKAGTKQQQTRPHEMSCKLLKV